MHFAVVMLHFCSFTCIFLRATVVLNAMARPRQPRFNLPSIYSYRKCHSHKIKKMLMKKIIQAGFNLTFILEILTT